MYPYLSWLIVIYFVLVSYFTDLPNFSQFLAVIELQIALY